MSPGRPGQLERLRQDLKATDPALYGYIAALESSKALNVTVKHVNGRVPLEVANVLHAQADALGRLARSLAVAYETT